MKNTKYFKLQPSKWNQRENKKQNTAKTITTKQQQQHKINENKKIYRNIEKKPQIIKTVKTNKRTKYEQMNNRWIYLK